MGPYLISLTYWALGIIAMLLADHSEAEEFRFQGGSPDLCPQKNLARLQGLPGYGWDNLRNVEMSAIYEPTYHNCRVTTDRKYLIPDNIKVWPEKKSDLHIFSTLFLNVSDYTNALSTSINIDPGFSGTFVDQSGTPSTVKISGSFSFEYEKVKRHMVKNDAATTRTECRYVFYKIRNNPDLPLANGLRKRLYDIASAIQSNKTETVSYLADLLVRDFGTHVVNKVDVGAAIVREDQVASGYVEDHANNTWGINAAAAGSFSKAFQNFSLGFNFSFSTTTQKIEQYESNCTNSDVYGYGGPPIGSDLVLSQWLSDVEDNLVTVDRSGDPLWFLISSETLPEIPLDTLRELSKVVENAVKSYYKHNVYPGCTSIDSPNFSYIANVDDGTCQGPKTNYTFGGIYQTCSGGRCEVTILQKNPLSGGYSCPSGFTPIKLYERRVNYCERKCKSNRWTWLTGHKDCWDECGTDRNSATYKAYWCADKVGSAPDSGYMFGGLFTSNLKNPMTHAHSCPVHFSALKFGTDGDAIMYVCVSDDYELGFRYSLPFAGFFSCNVGNPLSLSKPLMQLSNSPGQGKAMKLSSFVYQEGPSNWPQRCPQGYSQHLFGVPRGGCAIHYCVKSGSLSIGKLPVIRRPPFTPEPEVLTNATRLLATSSGQVLSRSGAATEWKQLKMESQMEESDLSSHLQTLIEETNQSDGKRSTTVTAVVSVMSATIGGLIVLVVFLVIRKPKKKRDEPLLSGGSEYRRHSYGPVAGDGESVSVSV